MRKAKYLIFLLIITAVLLETVNIYFLNKISTDSLVVKKLKEQIRDYDQENSQLSMEVLRFTSLEKISSQASELGFVKPSEFISLFSPSLFAAKK